MIAEIILVLVSVLIIAQFGFIWYILGVANNMIILNSKFDELYKIIAKDDKKKKRAAKKPAIGFKTSATEAAIANKKK